MSTDDPSHRSRRFGADASARTLPRRASELELRVRIAALEAELERERERRQTVIERYERLLDEQSRRNRSDDRDEDERVWDGDIFSLLLD